jgi:hypothetical protein
MEQLLQYVTGFSNPTFHSPLITHTCQTSCPDCVRDFSNLSFHNILDWRLGLDLARLALDPTSPIDLSVNYWQALAAIAAAAYFNAQPLWQPTTFGSLPGARRGNRAQIIVHPLWIRDPNVPSNWCADLAAAHADAAAAGVTTIEFKSVFDVLRRPYA